MVTLSSATSGSTSSAPASGSSSGSAVRQKTVNYNQFLQLLVAEMRNQDPTNPMDPTQTVSQLASFSSVEQQVRTNRTLDNLLTGLNLPNPATGGTSGG